MPTSTPPAAPKTPDTPAPKTPDTPPVTPADTSDPLAAAVGQLLTIADGLKAEKEQLLKRIGANRDTLRNLALQGAGTPEQQKAITAHYPERKKGAEDTPAAS